MRKKTLLEKLGERYYTIEHNGGYLLYDKEGKAKRANVLFKGLFYLASSGKSYVFQEEYYETPEELIHAMEEWAKTLPFDVELYNPSFKKSYMIECAVVCSCPKYDKDELYFFRTKSGGWFSADRTSFWQAGELDVDGEIFRRVMDECLSEEIRRGYEEKTY